MNIRSRFCGINTNRSICSIGLRAELATPLRTIVLAGFVTRSGDEKLGATAASASGLLAAHGEPHLKEQRSTARKKTKPEEGGTAFVLISHRQTVGHRRRS